MAVVIMLFCANEEMEARDKRKPKTQLRYLVFQADTHGNWATREISVFLVIRILMK
jgi:hypothetical protein